MIMHRNGFTIEEVIFVTVMIGLICILIYTVSSFIEIF